MIIHAGVSLNEVLLVAIAPTLASIGSIIVSLINRSTVRKTKVAVEETQVQVAQTKEDVKAVHGLINSRMTDWISAVREVAFKAGMDQANADVLVQAAQKLAEEITGTNPIKIIKNGD